MPSRKPTQTLTPRKRTQAPAAKPAKPARKPAPRPSPARSAAARRNGAKSRGPVTAAGKKKCSLNALRHGLLAKHLLLRGESEEIFLAVVDQHVRKFQPCDDIEYALIEEMAAIHWRLRRTWAIEANLLNKAAKDKMAQPDGDDFLAGAFAKLTKNGVLHLIDRYENRLHRMYQRSLHNFLLLREVVQEEDGPTTPTSALMNPPPPAPAPEPEKSYADPDAVLVLPACAVEEFVPITGELAFRTNPEDMWQPKSKRLAQEKKR